MADAQRGRMSRLRRTWMAVLLLFAAAVMAAPSVSCVVFHSRERKIRMRRSCHRRGCVWSSFSGCRCGRRKGHYKHKRGQKKGHYKHKHGGGKGPHKRKKPR